jgi:cob(I)alamin adenosyltransferase
MSIDKGLVYVFTGEGKGKTSAALGVAVRAAAAGMKVGWVSWYKEERQSISEKRLAEIEMYFMGKGFYNLPGDKLRPEEHKQAAAKALEKAEELVKRVDVLVLDEVNNAVEDGLIKLIKLIKLISKRGKTHLILTGRGAVEEIIRLADLATEMRKIKHPFDRGVKAIKGLDY